jgi:DDE superfamily endonuclease
MVPPVFDPSRSRSTPPLHRQRLGPSGSLRAREPPPAGGDHLLPEAVFRTLTLLCALVEAVPIGTNLGLLHVLWMVVSGRLLASRGAVYAGLSACGLADRAVRRAWAALGRGNWASAPLLARWGAIVEAEGRWRAHRHGGYRPLAVDVTGFWRPRLRGCPTTHDHGAAGKALPAIPAGLIARVGSVGAQRLALPRAFVRADPADPTPGAHTRRLVREAVRQGAADEVLVLDAGFGVALLQEEGAARCVVRLAKNATFRRVVPPPYGGRGRPATRGAVVRPLARTYKGRAIPATGPDRVETWHEGDELLRAAIWAEVVLPDAEPGSPSCTVVAIHDPRHREPLLLATSLPLPPRAARECYRDRWPVEQLPLAAKQLLGAARQFVHAPETCQRLPELALLAGAVLSYAAATAPAIPTGFWDRRPQRTPGRLRRLLARTPFPQDFPVPLRIREKASVTNHLPKGYWAQRGRAPVAPATPTALAEVA